MPNLVGLGGWIPDGRHRIFAEGLPVAQRPPPGFYGAHPEPTEPIQLYLAWRHVLGSYPNYPAQEIGDCTSHSLGHAVDLLQCIEIVGGEESIYKETCTEAIYGMGREKAGMLGYPGDGCYGSAVVKAATQMGMVPRSVVNPAQYSGQRARQWGHSGAPVDIEQKAAPFLMQSVSRIMDWDTLIAALWNLHPVTVCSSQGFTLVRDQNGFCSPKGQWDHAMLIAGARFDRPGALICNSWGSDSPSGPVALDQPPFSFWVDKSIVNRMLAAGDSWALTGAPDFEEKPKRKRLLAFLTGGQHG